MVTESRPRILLVEDEKDIRELMLLHLKREGLDVLHTDNGEEGWDLFQKNKLDLAILDWMLPGVSGLELCERMKRKQPVLMVTARAEPEDIVTGLDAGADDYVTKPFEIPVFLARVRALLRRGETGKALGSVRVPSKGYPQGTLVIGNLVINEERHEAHCGSNALELTASEFRLLAAMMNNAGKVLSRQRLIGFVQGEGISVTDRAIDTHVFGLRKKLGPCGDFVETIRGVGYRVKSE